MIVTENLLQSEYGVKTDPELLVEAAVMPNAPSVTLISDLEDIVFRLRSFMESADGDIGLGVEMGMQRAADMIENVLQRHGSGD